MRHKRIQKHICREELKSRLPSLFAYLEENEDGTFILHKATDSLQGCYGKIVQDVRLPGIQNGNESEEERIYLKIDDVVYLKSGDICSYRTLMSYYNQYREYELGDGDVNELTKFMEDAIGKVEIDINSLKWVDDEQVEWDMNEMDNDLIPSYVFLSNVRYLLSVYSNLRNIYHTYCGNSYTYDINTLEKNICCKCALYRRMGGDAMYEKLNELVADTDYIANLFYGYANNDECSVKINLCVNLCQTINDSGFLSTYLNKWVGGESHYNGELYTYEGRTYMCIQNNNDLYDEESMTYSFDKTNFRLISDNETRPADVVLENKSDSKLKSMRKFVEYINEMDEEERPEDGEDWLYYYKIGSISNYNVVTDEFGNIANCDSLEDGILEPAGNSVDKLAAYGNVITSITADSANRIITFVYYVNAHLKASRYIQKTDDDGNVLYLYDGFYYDDTDDLYHGVRYTESYRYDEGGEIDTLVNEGMDLNLSTHVTFANYVNDLNDEYPLYEKFPFNTSIQTILYDKSIENENMTIKAITSDFYVKVKKDTDWLCAEAFKEDWINGISYKPEVNSDVFIDRGNYSAFERHIKLSEIKTLEDMENYSNGSFFKMQKMS